MANLFLGTEAFHDTGVWTHNDITVTANTHAAPAFAGGSAGLADTVADTAAGAQGFLLSVWIDIPTNTDPYVGSIHIRKDANTTRWPEFVIGTDSSVNGYVNLNTSTGAIADGSTPPAASGIIDVDASWWRLWQRIANNGTGTALRILFFPDHLDGLGGGGQSAGTGSVILWGVNITQSSTVQPYEPEPFYAFGGGSSSENLFYRRRR